MISHDKSGRRHMLACGTGLALAAPLLSASVLAVADPAAATKKVLDHHLGAFAKGLDELMLDYASQSTILSGDKRFKGTAEIRGFFDAFLKGVKPGFWEAFKIQAQAIDREVAYLVWEAKPFVPKATDTLLVRGGKIIVQTFTAA
jgi:hypothetical protein